MGDTRIRCATFNVLHGRRIQEDGSPAPEPADFRLPLAEAVASLDADVIALQELDRLQERSGCLDQAAVAATAGGAEHWRYASAWHCRPVPGGGWVRDPAEPGLRVYGPPDTLPHGQVPSHGVALLSRLPVLEWRALRLPPAPFGLPLRVAGRRLPVPARDQPRAALAAVVEGRRGPFTAVALHLSFVPGWNVGQLLAVRRWITDLPRPHVLLGDLNLIGPIPQITLNAAERTPTWPLRRPSADVPPAPVWRTPERVRTFPSHRPAVQLDHILTTGIGPDGIGVDIGTAHAPRTPISDHRPLVAELAL